MFASIPWWQIGVTAPVALSAVALFGYLFGRTQNRADHARAEANLMHASEVISELESISKRIRRSLATQHSSVQIFRQKLDEMREVQDSQLHSSLTDEAEKILQPTMALSNDIVHAYEEIRQQTSSLSQLKGRPQPTSSSSP